MRCAQVQDRIGTVGIQKVFHGRNVPAGEVVQVAGQAFQKKAKKPAAQCRRLLRQVFDGTGKRIAILCAGPVNGLLRKLVQEMVLVRQQGGGCGQTFPNGGVVLLQQGQ